jgi:hypothetical protein
MKSAVFTIVFLLIAVAVNAQNDTTDAANTTQVATTGVASTSLTTQQSAALTTKSGTVRMAELSVFFVTICALMSLAYRQ